MKFVPLIIMLFSIYPSTLAQTPPSQVRVEPYLFQTSDGQKIEAELGHLTVPENRHRSRNSMIELAFVRFKSRAANPSSPIVYLAGGPGGSGIALARGPRGSLLMAMREVADVIALDQRGAGMSKPNLACSETLDYPLDKAGDRAEMLRLFQQKSRSCAQRWKDRGVDLPAYNTEENADDLEDLRKALGVEKISLWGSSYGTHLALAMIRRHGNSIYRVILAGVEGPDHTLKLPSDVEAQLLLVNDLAKTDARINAVIPDFRQLMIKVWQRLEKQPAVITITDPRSKQPVGLALGKFDLQRLTAALLGDRAGKEAIPALYHSLSVNDYSSFYLKYFARMIADERQGSIGSAMAYAMDCASGASAQRRERIRREAEKTLFGDLIDFPLPEVCDAWGIPELKPPFRSPVRSAVPTLFLSGTLDGRTPPSNAEEVRKNFRNSYHVIIEGAGHGNELFISSPKIKDVMLEFMKSGKVSTTRITLPPLTFRPLVTQSGAK